MKIRLLVALLAGGLSSTSAQTYTWTTIAGFTSTVGTADGTGTDARFNFPAGLALDGAGNLYVTDRFNSAIRKVTPAGVVTTLAGVPGQHGSADGTGSSARFNAPQDVAASSDGTVYVADFFNNTIRKITPSGVVTTIAGAAGQSGSTDGPGSAARFNAPLGIAVDAAGNIYVGDYSNRTIRKITPAGVVSTLAGQSGVSGSADGFGSAARFNLTRGLAVDGDGAIHLTEPSAHTIRKVTPGGLVTTLAGLAGQSGATNGLGPAARFNNPDAVDVDNRGNVFVADSLNSTIRMISPAGVVTTVAGSAGSNGSADGASSSARFRYPGGIVVDGSGNLYVADTANQTIRKGTLVVAPVIASSPQSQHVIAGAGATFNVPTAGDGVSYQWKKDGIAIGGATDSTYQIASTAAGDMGFYSVIVTNAAGSTESSAALLTVATTGPSRLGNLSTRGHVAAGDDLTVGFVLRGSGAKSLLVRAVGPTLGAFGVDGTLADPRLDVIPAGASVAVNSNDDWAGGTALASAFASVGAFALPTTSKDAAVVATLPVANYTARITSSVAGGSGIAIAEVYDRDLVGTGSQLANVSTLGFVGTGTQALTPGFVIDGTAPKLLLVRAVGPGLAALGVGGTLADPQLAIIPLGKSFTIAGNDNWNNDPTLATAFTAAGAFALPASSKDAAVVVRLPPGGYTVTVSGVADTTGRALVEIYDLDP